jgi:predicted O-linked N-acetylglucosamine transferase (SPINDLY family)
MPLNPSVPKYPAKSVAAGINQATAYLRQGEFAKAESVCITLRMAEPRNFDVLYLSGMVAAAQGKLEFADATLKSASVLKPDVASLHSDRGVVLQRMGQLTEAVDCYRRAIGIDSKLWMAHFNGGIALNLLGESKEAITFFDAVLALKPDFAAALSNKGIALKNLGELDAATDAFRKAIQLNPNAVDAHCNLGNLLQTRSDYLGAIEYYKQALKSNPNYPDALCNMGAALVKLNRGAEAIACFDSAIRINPRLVQAHSNRGILLVDSAEFESAIPSLETALSYSSNVDFLLSSLLRAKMSLCDWRGIEQWVEKLHVEIAEAKAVSNPFAVIGLIDSPALQKTAAETCIRRMYPADDALGAISPWARHEKIRVGYFSADFHDHATMYLMAELFELHDRSAFEIYAFSFGAETQGKMRSRILPCFDRFIEVGSMSDMEVARLSRTLEIDIAVDLKGLTAHSRPKIFAYRAAPAQVAYLGHPGTTGAEYIDYVIADEIVLPKGEREHFSERVLYVPHSYQVNDRKRGISSTPGSKFQHDLPQAGVVYCCFNSTYKITPAVFDSWMRILLGVDTSVLWLLQSTQKCVENLRAEAARRGVDPARLIFAEQRPLEEHLARYRHADLFLDTSPCSAHTTASDALWAGVPVLTCMGSSFASRVAGSLLHAVGLPEMVVNTWHDYEALAVELGRDQAALEKLRQKLDHNRLTTPLFDSGLFTKNIESVYREICTKE